MINAKIGSDQWWRETPREGYGGIYYHICSMVAGHHITPRKAVELLEYLEKVDPKHYYFLPGNPPEAPWDEYLAQGDEPSCDVRTSSVRKVAD